MTDLPPSDVPEDDALLPDALSDAVDVNNNDVNNVDDVDVNNLDINNVDDVDVNDVDVDVADTAPEAEPVATYTTEELVAAANAEPDFGEPAAASPKSPPPPLPPPGPQPTGQPGPPPAAGPPPMRRLYRSRHDRKVGGVSAGIAEYFGIDPTIVRLATLAFMISGVGLLVYIAAWIIVPMRPEGAPYHQPAQRIASEKTMTLAFGLGALALAFGIVTGSWQVLAFALIGGGIWLLSEHTVTPMPFATAAPGAPAPGVGAPAAEHTSSFADTTYPPPTYQAPTYATPQQPPTPTYVAAPKERKPQRITWVVLSLLALLASVGIAAATGDWWNVSATRFLGIAVIIIGIGVVVGQLRNGGARGLIPLGILAALALFPVSAVDGLIDEGIGENVYRPLAVEQVADSYQHGIGKLTVDLSEIDFAGRSDTIDIDLGIGELIVIVPDDAGGQAVLQAKAGEISHRLPNTNSFRFEEGVNIETGTVRLQGDNGTLDLNINVGLGTAELQSVPSS